MSARSTDYEQVSVSENPSELDLNEGEKLLGTGAAVSKKRKWSRWLRLWGLIGAAFVTALVVFGLGYMSGYDQRSMDGSASASTSLDNEAADKATAGNCTEPYFRREWRSLSDKDKKAYLDAVKCFVDSPSAMGKNGTLYDDFSWVHNLIAHSSTTPNPQPPSGNNRFPFPLSKDDSKHFRVANKSVHQPAHGKAPFLTWHRRFIWVYEKTLREKCDYEGALPYEAFLPQ
jgi:tyrosinase